MASNASTADENGLDEEDIVGEFGAEDYTFVAMAFAGYDDAENLNLPLLVPTRDVEVIKQRIHGLLAYFHEYAALPFSHEFAILNPAVAAD